MLRSRFGCRDSYLLLNWFYVCNFIGVSSSATEVWQSFACRGATRLVGLTLNKFSCTGTGGGVAVAGAVVVAVVIAAAEALAL